MDLAAKTKVFEIKFGDSKTSTIMAKTLAEAMEAIKLTYSKFELGKITAVTLVAEQG